MKNSYPLPEPFNMPAELVASASPNPRISSRIDGKCTAYDLLIDYFFRDERFFSNAFTMQLNTGVQKAIKAFGDGKGNTDYVCYNDGYKKTYSESEVSDITEDGLAEMMHTLTIAPKIYLSVADGNLVIKAFAKTQYSAVIEKTVCIYGVTAESLPNLLAQKYVPLIKVQDDLIPTRTYNMQVKVAGRRLGVPSQHTIKYFIKSPCGKSKLPRVVCLREIVTNKVENETDPLGSDFASTPIYRSEATVDLSKFNTSVKE